MKLQAYVPDPLNEQASALVDAQTDIKTAIKQGVLSGAPLPILKDRIRKIITRALSRIRSPTLKEDAQKSLIRYVNTAYGRFTLSLEGIPPKALPAVVVLMRGITQSAQRGAFYKPNSAAEMRAMQTLSYRETAKGIPLQEFQKNYMNRISKALEGLAQESALDPNDLTGRNSLRNLAEMQVRYERHQQEIATLKTSGARLVVCSVHADCSDRCAPWQGRVYSLDGTSGRTEDGRSFQPLENATDIFYTTKAGRTYKNGLLGFNCRHALFEYKPRMAIPRVGKAEQTREYAVTKRQREMERAVLRARENALAAKDVDFGEWRKWKRIATERYEEYKHFSMNNSRAFYPDRVKIL